MALVGEPGLCQKAAMFSLLTLHFLLVSHPPFPNKQLLNQPVGTQGRSWGLDEG